MAYLRGIDEKRLDYRTAKSQVGDPVVDSSDHVLIRVCSAPPSQIGQGEKVNSNVPSAKLEEKHNRRKIRLMKANVL